MNDRHGRCYTPLTPTSDDNPSGNPYGDSAEEDIKSDDETLNELFGDNPPRYSIWDHLHGKIYDNGKNITHLTWQNYVRKNIIFHDECKDDEFLNKRKIPTLIHCIDNDLEIILNINIKHRIYKNNEHAIQYVFTVNCNYPNIEKYIDNEYCIWISVLNVNNIIIPFRGIDPTVMLWKNENCEKYLCHRLSDLHYWDCDRYVQYVNHSKIYKNKDVLNLIQNGTENDEWIKLIGAGYHIIIKSQKYQ